MRASFRKLLGRTLVAATAFTVAGTMADSADQRSAAPSNWEHVRIIGAQLGVPRTVSLGAVPPRSLAIGDFDGDGDADVVAGASGASEVVVLLNDGSGRFGSTVVVAREDWPTVDAATYVEGIGYRAQSNALSSTTTVWPSAAPQDARGASQLAVVADFDDDGTVDVATASAVGLDAAIVALASGDFDGDGVIDLAAADAARHPKAEAATASIGGIAVPRLAVAAGLAALPMVLAALRTSAAGD